MPRIYNSKQQKQIVKWFKQGLGYSDIKPHLTARGWPVLNRSAVHYYKKAYSSNLIGSRPLKNIVDDGGQTVSRRALARGVGAYIYLLWMEGGFHKIGVTVDVSRRLKNFSFLPYEVRLIHHFYKSDAAWFEAELHKKFAHKRVRGEWFLLSEEDVRFIKGLTSDSLL